MRPTTHVVTLSGGSLTLPLGMAALRALASVPAVPGRPELGPVDPAQTLRGDQSPGTLVLVEALVACANVMPGAKVTADDLLGMATQNDVTAAAVAYFLAIVRAMGPEKPQEAAQKS
jgi:hypothetical protein